jgi:uncharacterized protein YkwD
MNRDRKFRLPARLISAAIFLSRQVRRPMTWKQTRVLPHGSILFIGLFLFPAWAPAQSAGLPAEAKILQFINQERSRKNLASLELDQHASQICRAHSEEMKRGNFFSLSSPGKGSLKERMKRNGVFGLFVSAFAMRERSLQDIFAQMKKRGLLDVKSCTHVGIGIHSAAFSKYGPNVLWCTLAFLDYGVKLEPLPQKVDAGYALRLQGVCLPGYSHPRLFVTLPKGKVSKVHNSLASLTYFLFQWTFDQGPGTYTLEIMVDDAQWGPRAAALIPVQVGGAGPPLPAPAPYPRQDAFKTTQEAADFLFLLVNRARAEHGIQPLRPDVILQSTAMSHSQDMARQGYCAHFNPQGESPLQRLKNHGGRGQVAENISCTGSISEAHRGLMESPGHRANILNEDFTHMGIGVARLAEQYYVTQLFQRKRTEENMEQVRQTIYHWLNRERIQKGMPALALDPILTQAATDHSSYMVSEESLPGEAGIREFQKQFSRRGGKFKTLVVYQLIADSTARIVEQLEKQKAHFMDRQFTHTGIGVQSGYSPTQDERMLWVTLAFSSPE